MGTMLGFIAVVAVSSHLAPQLTRREIFFGVTVPSRYREGPLARSVSRRYAAEVWLLAAVAAAIVATSPMPFVSGSMLLAQSIGASVAFARAWSSVRPHAVMATTIREAAMGPLDRLPGGLLGQLGPFLILLAAAAYVALNWEHVPARVPTHWNLAGKPDGWIAKSVPGVFAASPLASSPARCCCSRPMLSCTGRASLGSQDTRDGRLDGSGGSISRRCSLRRTWSRSCCRGRKLCRCSPRTLISCACRLRCESRRLPSSSRNGGDSRDAANRRR